MFMPDSGSEFFHSGSRIQVKNIPDPGSRSASKNISIALGKIILDVHPGSEAPDPGSGSATLFLILLQFLG